MMKNNRYNLLLSPLLKRACLRIFNELYSLHQYNYKLCKSYFDSSPDKATSIDKTYIPFLIR